MSLDNAPCVRVVLKTFILSDNFWIFFSLPIDTDTGEAVPEISLKLLNGTTSIM